MAPGHQGYWGVTVGLGFRVWGLGFYGLGFRVWGLGVRVDDIDPALP